MNDSDTATFEVPRTTLPRKGTAAYTMQARVEDAAVRAARKHSWCDVVGAVLWQLFPAGPLAGGGEQEYGTNKRGWRDSDGFDCDGRDPEGRDVNGFSLDGWDRDGYGRDGYNMDGHDRQGLDREGFGPDADPYRYDGDGYDRDMFDSSGRVAYGLTRANLRRQQARPAEDFRFDRDNNPRPTA